MCDVSQHSLSQIILYSSIFRHLNDASMLPLGTDEGLALYNQRKNRVTCIYTCIWKRATRLRHYMGLVCILAFLSCFMSECIIFKTVALEVLTARHMLLAYKWCAFFSLGLNHPIFSHNSVCTKHTDSSTFCLNFSNDRNRYHINKRSL